MSAHFPSSKSVLPSQLFSAEDNLQSAPAPTAHSSNIETAASSEKGEPHQVSSLTELPLIIFSGSGSILELNAKARELFQSFTPAAIQDLLFTPDYFLEMTRSSFYIDKNQQLIWGIDLRLGTGSIAPSRATLATGPSPDVFHAVIEPSNEKSAIDPAFSLHNSCVIKYSQKWAVLSSEGTERILGFKAEELLLKRGSELFHSDDWTAFQQRASRQKGALQPLRLRHLTKDQGPVFFEVFGIEQKDTTFDCIIRGLKLGNSSEENPPPCPQETEDRPAMKEKPPPPLIQGLPLPKRTAQSPPLNLRISLDRIKPEPSPEIKPPFSRGSYLPSYDVFVVEDNTINQNVIRRILQNLKQNVVYIAPNGKDALEFLDSADHLPDLIITDKNMPIMDGIEFLKRVRSTPKLEEIYCILWSDDIKSLDQIDIEKLKISEFLAKPANKEDIKQALTTFSQNPRGLSPKKRSLDEHVQTNQSQDV